MKTPRKLDKAFSLSSAKMVAMARPSKATDIQLAFYRRHGMCIVGKPNYISSKVWIDGTDYSKVSLGDGCTISSYVRILTHDWSPYTALRSYGITINPPIGRFGSVSIGAFAFVGSGTIILPGSTIGRGAIVGAGSAVRGLVEAGTVVAGSPAIQIGTVEEMLKRRFPSEWARVAASIADDERRPETD